jgi:hypothetical protein
MIPVPRRPSLIDAGSAREMGAAQAWVRHYGHALVVQAQGIGTYVRQKAGGRRALLAVEGSDGAGVKA